MKILAKQRLAARQLPAELMKSTNSYEKTQIARRFKWLGIDLNTAQYKEVSKQQAIEAIKKKPYSAILCVYRNTFKHYSLGKEDNHEEFGIIAQDIDLDNNRIEDIYVDYSTDKQRVKVKRLLDISTKLYLFSSNRQTAERLGLLQKTRNENEKYTFDRASQFEIDNIRDMYDKSGYKKRHLSSEYNSELENRKRIKRNKELERQLKEIFNH